MNLQEAIEKAGLSASIELINIPMDEVQMVLMRKKGKPTAALVWMNPGPNTATMFTLPFPGGKKSPEYTVVCPCCWQGFAKLNPPPVKEGECKKCTHERWHSMMDAKFKDAVISTCKKNDVCFLLVRSFGKDLHDDDTHRFFYDKNISELESGANYKRLKQIIEP